MQDHLVLTLFLAPSHQPVVVVVEVITTSLPVLAALAAARQEREVLGHGIPAQMAIPRQHHRRKATKAEILIQRIKSQPAVEAEQVLPVKMGRMVLQAVHLEMAAQARLQRFLAAASHTLEAVAAAEKLPAQMRQFRLVVVGLAAVAQAVHRALELQEPPTQAVVVAEQDILERQIQRAVPAAPALLF